MIIGIHPDQFNEESFSAKWAEFLEARGVAVRWLDLLATDALEQIRGVDGVMWRWAHNQQHKQSARTILYTIEHILKIPVFPDSRSCWHFDDKIAQYYIFQAAKIPTPDTWVFWTKWDATQFIQNARFPAIFKLAGGAASANVIKINDIQEAQVIIDKMFSGGIYPYTLNEFKSERPGPNPPYWKPEIDYFYFQEYLAENQYDTRVTVLGEHAFAFRRFNRPGDFRASGNTQRDYNPANIDLRMIKLAIEISLRLGFASMAYDFIYKAGEPVICEMSYTFPHLLVYNALGHWKSNLEWVEGQVWAEEIQVDDFIRRIIAHNQQSR